MNRRNKLERKRHKLQLIVKQDMQRVEVTATSFFYLSTKITFKNQKRLLYTTLEIILLCLAAQVVWGKFVRVMAYSVIQKKIAKDLTSIHETACNGKSPWEEQIWKSKI